MQEGAFLWQGLFYVRHKMNHAAGFPGQANRVAVDWKGLFANVWRPSLFSFHLPVDSNPAFWFNTGI